MSEEFTEYMENLGKSKAKLEMMQTRLMIVRNRIDLTFKEIAILDYIEGVK